MCMVLCVAIRAHSACFALRASSAMACCWPDPGLNWGPSDLQLDAPPTELSSQGTPKWMPVPVLLHPVRPQA